MKAGRASSAATTSAAWEWTWSGLRAPCAASGRLRTPLHRVLDVQCGEDRSRARTGHAAGNLATLRRLALNLLRQDRTKKRRIKGKQLNASWPFDVPTVTGMFPLGFWLRFLKLKLFVALGCDKFPVVGSPVGHCIARLIILWTLDCPSSVRAPKAARW